MPEYDQFFKELFHRLLFRFLECYAPELAATLDPSRPPIFLDKEVPAEPRNKTADILAKVYTRQAQERLLHLEAQGQSQGIFPRRMHDYFQRFRRRHPSTPIHSIAVLLYRQGSTNRYGRYTDELDARVFLWFEYGIIPLADLHARDYLDHPDPLVHGLMGILRRGGLDAVQLKAQSLAKVLHGTKPNTDEREMLIDALDRYFVLPARDYERYRQLTVELKLEEAQEMMTLAEERGIEKGRVRQSQEILLTQLREKFGDAARKAEPVVRRLDRIDEITPYLKRILTAQNLEEMGLPS